AAGTGRRRQAGPPRAELPAAVPDHAAAAGAGGRRVPRLHADLPAAELDRRALARAARRAARGRRVRVPARPGKRPAAVEPAPATGRLPPTDLSRGHPVHGHGADGHPALDGPLNVLLIGVDWRQGQAGLFRADTIMVMHVPRTMDRAYLFSLPRDTLVNIDPSPQSGYPGGRDRINAAFAYGAGERQD